MTLLGIFYLQQDDDRAVAEIQKQAEKERNKLDGNSKFCIRS